MTFVDKGAVVKELIFEPFVDTNDIYYKLLALDILLINTLYPLRIIGLNQDEKTSGGMAGLTFLFRDSFGPTMYNNSNNFYIGWNQCQLGTYLLDGGGLCNSVKSAAVSITKYTMDGNSFNKYRNVPNCKAFILSRTEVDKSAMLCDGGGIGKNKNEVYMHFDANDLATVSGRMKLGFSNNWLRGNTHSADYSNTYVSAVANEGHLYHGATMTEWHMYKPAFCLG